MSFVFQQMIADKGEAYDVSTDKDATRLGVVTLCDGVLTVWDRDWGKELPMLFKREFPVARMDYGIEDEELAYIEANNGLSIMEDNEFSDDNVRQVYLDLAARVISENL